jgi:RimJ/RimL family protein N-acetyltransferase
MDSTGLIRSLELPPGCTPPIELRDEDIVATALGRADLVADVEGINASLDLIRRTRGGDWPSGPVTEEFDFVDLVWHELEFRERTSFAYAVYDTGGRYLGCCYLYPMGRRTPLDESLVRHDVDVSWWVTPDAYARGYDVKLHRALQRWVADAFGWKKPYFSNREIPGA